jgi:hypothetical protein
MSQSCRTCALYDLEAVKDARGRVRKDRMARCLWSSDLVVPESFLIFGQRLCGRMHPQEGTTCPCWKGRDDADRR